MIRKFIALTAVALLIGTPAVLAQDSGTDVPPSQEEGAGPEGHSPGKGPGKGHWEEIDKDGDGSVSKSEFVSKAEEHATKRFGKMDKDNDGKLTKEEMKAGFHKGREHFKEQKGKRGVRPGGSGEAPAFDEPPAE